MLGDLSHVEKIYIRTGYTDMRKQLNGLVDMIQYDFQLDPYSNAVFLFCGRRSDRIKGLVWTGLGFLQLYLRFEKGRLSWPRTPEQAADLSEDQFLFLMQGYNPLETRVREVEPQKIN